MHTLFMTLNSMVVRRVDITFVPRNTGDVTVHHVVQYNDGKTSRRSSVLSREEARAHWIQHRKEGYIKTFNE